MGLPHGKELSAAKVYIAPLPQVAEMCFTTEALGCYGGQTLVVVGESTDGIAPSSIATHEYGHHVAANRSNAPWPAIDWGTKRWASQVGVCSRVRSGMAFPGDEGMNYSLNPGEAFAESYRVLVETNGTAAGYDWPIIDPSFRPTPESLAALREDVLHRRVGPQPQRRFEASSFAKGAPRSTKVATLLDGDLQLRVTVPGGGADDVTLLSSDGLDRAYDRLLGKLRGKVGGVPGLRGALGPGARHPRRRGRSVHPPGAEALGEGERRVSARDPPLLPLSREE